MGLETETQNQAPPLIKKIRKPRTETKLQPSEPGTILTRIRAENTSVINLADKKLEVVVYISPLGDEEKIKDLLGEGGGKRYLFNGITSPHLRYLFEQATDNIELKVPCNVIEEEIFQFTYRKKQEREVYRAVRNLYHKHGN